MTENEQVSDVCGTYWPDRGRDVERTSQSAGWMNEKNSEPEDDLIVLLAADCHSEEGIPEAAVRQYPQWKKGRQVRTNYLWADYFPIE